MSKIDKTPQVQTVKQLTDDNTESYGVGIAKADRTYIGSDVNMSVRSEYNRSDYEYYRGGEKAPKTQKEIMQLCMRAYDRVFIVKNVIDLMADFVCQGITIFHPVKQYERFIREWWGQIEGSSVSERFANTIYRAGNVVIEKQFAKIPVKIEKKWSKAQEGNKPSKIEEPKYENRTIPYGYNFINPLCLDVLGDGSSTLLQKPQYIIRMSPNFTNAVNDLSRMYGPTIKTNMSYYGFDKSKTYIELDAAKFSVFHYKKDDWLLWGTPFSSAVLEQLRVLDKMHLADISALDGAISNIRLWKLGIFGKTLEESIIPSPSAIQKLRNILANNVGGGVLDLVWGPELDFKESNTQVHNFLGPDKYKQVMAEIYEGLGIPPTLTASGGDKGGYTNNYISMKTLIERLRYVRNQLLKFWYGEFKVIQGALGWDKPPIISFDYDILEDPSLVKKFWTDLWDRNVMSTETLREKVNLNNNVEEIRIKREDKAMKTGKRPPKASQFHDPQIEDKFKQVLLQGGGIAPSELGIELKPKKPGEKNLIEKQAKVAPKTTAPKAFKPKSPNGRPKSKKDVQKRKPKIVRIKTKADFVNLFLWANEAQKLISDLVSPEYLTKANKKNVRSLSDTEKNELEELKFNAFSNLLPYSSVVQENLVYSTNEDMLELVKGYLADFITKNNREPTQEEKRQIYSSAYAIKMENINGDNSDNS